MLATDLQYLVLEMYEIGCSSSERTELNLGKGQHPQTLSIGEGSKTTQETTSQTLSSSHISYITWTNFKAIY